MCSPLAATLPSATALMWEIPLAFRPPPVLPLAALSCEASAAEGSMVTEGMCTTLPGCCTSCCCFRSRSRTRPDA